MHVKFYNIIFKSFIYINFNTNGSVLQNEQKEMQHITLKQKDDFLSWLGLYGEGLVPCRHSSVSHCTGFVPVSETPFVYLWKTYATECCKCVFCADHYHVKSDFKATIKQKTQEELDLFRL
jgi:hypothetical protein